MGMSTLTLMTLAWELYQRGLPKVCISAQLGKHRETVHLWIKGIQQHMLLDALGRYQRAKTREGSARSAARFDPIIKRWVWAPREREADCCGEKIAYFLEQEYGVHLSDPKIYEILKEKYVIRSKWKRRVARGLVPHAQGPREVLQLDTIDLGSLFAFTGIDIYTKEADILVAPALTARYGCQFLEQAMARRFGGYVQLIQTDWGSGGSKRPSKSVCRPTAPAIGWLGPTRRTNMPLSRALTRRCGGSAWAGPSINWRTKPPAMPWWKPSWSTIIINHRPHLGLGDAATLTERR